METRTPGGAGDRARAHAAGAPTARSRSRTTPGPPTSGSCWSSPTREPVWRLNTRGDYWVLDRASGGSCASSAAATPSPRRSCSPSSRPTAGAWRTSGRTTCTSRTSTRATITAAHHRRLAHPHQRHLRLGVRRRADELLRRRMALEPGRPEHRLLAAQRGPGEELRPDQQHGFALLPGHPGPVSQGRRGELGGAHRHRRLRPAAPPAGSRSKATRAITTSRGWIGRPARAKSSSSGSTGCRTPTRSCWATRRQRPGPDRADRARFDLGGRGGRPGVAPERQGVHLGQRARRLEARVCRLARRQVGPAGDARADFDVLEVKGVDDKGGWLYYVASPDNPTQKYLFRTRLDGKGTPQRHQPERGAGDARLRPLAQLQVRHRELLEPRQPAGHPARPAAGQPGHSHPGRQRPAPGPRRRLAPPDGRMADRSRQPTASKMPGVLLKPADFDSTRKYPLAVLRVRRSGQRRGRGSVGRVLSLALDAHAEGLSGGQSWTTAAPPRRSAVPGARRSTVSSACSRPRTRRQPRRRCGQRPYVDPEPRRHLGLELRGVHDAERAVPASRAVPDGRGRLAR